MTYLSIIGRRLSTSVLLAVAVVSIGWALTRAAPGDAADAEFGQALTADARAAERAQAGLDQGTTASLLSWWRSALSLDLGTSLRFQRPVLPLVVERAGNSALLAACALAASMLVGLPLGVLSARGRGWVPQVIRVVSVTLLSIPPMVCAIVLAWIAVRRGWALGVALPAGSSADWVTRAVATGRALVVPALALAIPLAATLERLQSRALAGVADEPCLWAARARGIPDAAVWWRLAWRLSLPPVAGVGGVIAGALLSGALAVELITAWPGLGRLTYDALLARDAPLVAGCAAMTAVLVSCASLASDLVVAWADPRAREAA